MINSSILWKDFKVKLEELSIRLSVDELLVETIENVIDKVERAITLEQPYSEILDDLSIIFTKSYRLNIVSKVSREDFNFLCSLDDDYITLFNYVRKEDETIESKKCYNTAPCKKKLPKDDKITINDLYSYKQSGVKDYLFD